MSGVCMCRVYYVEQEGYEGINKFLRDCDGGDVGEGRREEDIGVRCVDRDKEAINRQLSLATNREGPPGEGRGRGRGRGRGNTK